MAEIASVIVDSREPTWVQGLTFGGSPVAVTALDAGDAMVATTDGAILVVERKTPSDLLSTIRSERLFPQCIRMRETSTWAYLVVTGILYCDAEGYVHARGIGDTKWNWDAVQGALLTCQELGVGVLQYRADEDFEGAVIRLVHRERGPVNTKARDGHILSAGEACLAALPGIGMERVGNLIRYCGSPAWALTWLTELDSPDRVPGIGSETKRKARAELGLDNGLALSVVTVDGAKEVSRNGKQG